MLLSSSCVHLALQELLNGLGVHLIVVGNQWLLHAARGIYYHRLESALFILLFFALSGEIVSLLLFGSLPLLPSLFYVGRYIVVLRPICLRLETVRLDRGFFNIFGSFAFFQVIGLLLGVSFVELLPPWFLTRSWSSFLLDGLIIIEGIKQMILCYDRLSWYWCLAILSWNRRSYQRIRTTTVKLSLLLWIIIKIMAISLPASWFRRSIIIWSVYLWIIYRHMI